MCAIESLPGAKWLFAFVLIGIALILFNILTAKAPTPDELADRAERLLNLHLKQEC